MKINNINIFYTVVKCNKCVRLKWAFAVHARDRLIQIDNRQTVWLQKQVFAISTLSRYDTVNRSSIIAATT